MDLFGIESAQQTTSLFKLGGVNRQAADTTKSVEAADTHNAVWDSSNIMAGHFVHAYREESRYIAGLKTGLALQNSFRDQMQAVLSKYRKLVELTGDPSYAKDAVKAVNSIVDNEVKDTNTEKLEEAREDIEKKADEAMATESQKALENETSPQEALDKSLDKAAPEAQPEAEGKQSVTEPVAAASETGQPQTTAAPEADSGQEAAAPEAAAPEADRGQETATPQEAYGDVPAATSIDLIV
ncbi:hypothetical protein [Pseudodesulfovibrio karagichevae]|uniref:Uncharacterized protein n=1 Tax=Pseudodesulfovibrio karagichevae TaxID=3239305 RepID=A0ABV4K1T8_9BACT